MFAIYLSFSRLLERISVFKIVRKWSLPTPFEKLADNSFYDHLEQSGSSSNIQCGFRSSHLTADILTVVGDGMAWSLTMSDAA